MASHFKKKRKEKGKPGVDYDARLHKAHNASEVKKQLAKVDDHDSWDKNGDTPLHSYIRRRDKERFNCMMTFLIHSKCDVNQANRDGQTALHLACQVNDLTMAKALVAFDARINSLNNSYYTPLDIVLDNHGDSDLKDLLYLVGGMTSEEKGYGGDYSEYDSGRLSPYMEIDVASRELGHQQPLMTQDYNGRPMSISVVANGYNEADFGDDESPSVVRRRLRGGISPPGGLSGLCEALPHKFMAARESSMAEDPLFMTARLDSDQDPLFMTAMTTCPLLPEDSGSDHHLKPINPGSSTEKEHSMASTSPSTCQANSKPVSVHSSLDIHLTCPISPTSSIENALTPLSVQALTLRGKLHHLIESAGEDSLASVYSSHEQPPFVGSGEYLAVRQDIQNLLVVCAYREFGCTWEGTYQELHQHIHTCSFASLKCEYCRETVRRSQFKSHNKSCPRKLKLCPLSALGCSHGMMVQTQLCDCVKGEVKHSQSTVANAVYSGSGEKSTVEFLNVKEPSDEAIVFREYRPTLFEAITEPEILPLANRLYSVDIITQYDLKEAEMTTRTPMDRMIRLLDAIEAAIRADKKKFDTLLYILGSGYFSLRDHAERMSRKLQELKLSTESVDKEKSQHLLSRLRKGVRKLFGAAKDMTSSFIKGALKKLKLDIQVSRKYKKRFDKHTNRKQTRWWFEIWGDESALTALEANWAKVYAETKWRLETCPVVSQQC